MSKPCQADATHHSSDRVTVYHGATEPLTLCGYHASRYPLVTLKQEVRS